ncbi:hypothetical protein BG015_006436, partial [Linnemannia schmuckeri]
MVSQDREPVRLKDRVEAVLEQQARALVEGGLGGGQVGESEADSSANESDIENPRPFIATKAAPNELDRYKGCTITSWERVEKYRNDPLS